MKDMKNLLTLTSLIYLVKRQQKSKSTKKNTERESTEEKIERDAKTNVV